MPIISASDSISLTPTSHRNNINDEAVTLIDTARKVTSVNNIPESLSFQLTNTVDVEANIGLWHKIKNYILPGRKGEAADEAGLGKVLTEGQILRQDIDNIAEQLRLRAETREPAFSLKTKAGWFIGTVLALVGSGVGLYRWRNPGNHHDNYSAKPDEIQKPSYVADNNYLNSDFQPCSYNKSQAENWYRCSPPENSALKNSSSPPVPKNPLRKGLIKRETPIQSLSEISKPVDGEINNYQDALRTIKRWRNRLIGYVHAYIDVPEDVDNKYLAQQVLSLIAQHSLHESKIAHIYLYATGLYGERIGESMSSDVQRQLVGDLLAKLLYGQSLEDYLVDAFSKNRYISIKDFRNNIIESIFSFAESDSISQMKIFQDRYLIPCMPMLNLDLSYYSNIVVGSVTWFLIYLSSETEWIDAVKSREIDAVMYGIDVLNYFIAGNLTQGSKNKIHMGLKFTGLYFEYDATSQTLPSFQMLWNAFREALIKHLSLSSVIVTKLKTINKNMKSIGDQPWTSQHEFADYMLRKFCKKDNIQLFFIRERRKVVITKKEFIESVNEQAWCRITHKNKRVSIKIPTIKYKYKRLSNDVFSLISITSNILMGNALIPSDYFNPKLDDDDYLFIEKSALEVVSMALHEVRSPQERRIGPPLRKVVVKEKYLFFEAINNKERRLYAIDKTYKTLIQRVAIDFKNLQHSVGIFFNGWYPHPGYPLELIVYRDRNINISISEHEPIAVFVEKIVTYNIKVIKEIMLKHDKELSAHENSSLEIIKELFIPLYSCVTALDGDDATGAFISCFLDGIFFIFPVMKKITTVTGRSVGKVIDISFLIKNSESFRMDSSILWKKVVTDFHIYNTILNEQSMLRSSVVDLLLDILDPGIGLMKEVRGITKSVASTIVKGGLIRLPLTSLKNFRNVAEFSVKAKSIIDSSKKIAVKVSKPSGRLSSHYHDYENKDTSFPSLYGSAYQFGDYYAYYSSRDDIDMILAITDETTSKEENIYVTLSEDEFNGVIFRCICKETELSLCNMAPIVTPELSAIKIIRAISHKTIIDNKLIFKQRISNQFDNLVFYPNHQGLLFEDGLSTNKLYTIFKIGNVHYLFNPDKKQLRLLHDGDRVEVKRRDQTADSYYLNRDREGNLVVRLEPPESDSASSVFNVEYAFGGFFPLTESETKKNKMTLSFISDKLCLNHLGRYFNLEMTTIRNQFSITDLRHRLPSFIVGWHSLVNEFTPAKPYLKKSSPHIGMTLEEIVDENCGYEDKLKKFPTLLLSGAVSAQFDMKLRVFDMYYSLGKSANGLFPLECNGFHLPMFFWLYYDLLTESFELVSSQQSLVPPTNYTVPPYKKLLSQMFSVEKFPDIAEIINLNEEQYNHKLTMRLRQAAFLQRLNPVDRLDTLQLPLVQVHSWELHPDVQKFQKKYPAAALWMTWQRQLHRLMKNKLSHELPLIKRMHLLNSENKIYTSGLLINSQYSYHETIWISVNETEEYIIFHDENNHFYSEVLDYEDDEIEWLPKAKYANQFPITQFMHEKNVLPKITINRKDKNVKIYDCYLGNVYLERYTASNEIEYFIISASGEWFASIDNKRHLLVYNLREKNIIYTQDKQPVIYAKYYYKLDEHADQNYALFSLTDTGVLYYPRNHLWVENNGDGVLWSPSINYFPAFISEDQRFLGFKYQNKIDVIIYDQKRALMALLKCPLSQQSDINITAVAFSALNAVVAVAFDDGHVYLYDLIRERKNLILNPIAHVKLQNIIGSESHNRIMMRFKGVFDTLTIIHPVALFTPNNQYKEVIYVRSSYGFHGDKR